MENVVLGEFSMCKKHFFPDDTAFFVFSIHVIFITSPRFSLSTLLFTSSPPPLHLLFTSSPPPLHLLSSPLLSVVFRCLCCGRFFFVLCCCRLFFLCFASLLLLHCCCCFCRRCSCCWWVLRVLERLFLVSVRFLFLLIFSVIQAIAE